MFIGESRRRDPETGTAGAPMAKPLMRALDGIANSSSADIDKLRLSRDWALRLIGDKPDGEIAIAGHDRRPMWKKGSTADNLRKGPNPPDFASPIDKP